MNTLPKFHPGQSAVEANKSLKLALEIKSEAHQCSLDWFGEIYDRKLYKELGFSTINRYAKLELGFCPSKIGDYLKLTHQLKKLPVLKKVLSTGKLGYTAGRVISSIANEKTETQWVEFALKNSRRVVENEVKRARQEAREDAARQPSLLPSVPRKTPAAVIPVRVNLEMTPTQFARYEAMMEQLQKNRSLSNQRVEALLEIMASFLESVSQNSSSREDICAEAKPPAQIHIHHCPECESSMVQTSKGEMEIGKTELERYQCDCRISKPDQRNTASTPPALRRKILANARHKCQMPGCNHSRFLEVHHIIPRALGGSNSLENLICYCSACHALIHNNPPGLMVKSPVGSYRYHQRS